MMPCYVIDGVLVLITGMFINIIWCVNDSEKYENFTIKLKFMSICIVRKKVIVDNILYSNRVTLVL